MSKACRFLCFGNKLRLSELMEPYFLYTKKKLRAASRRALAPLSLVRLSVLRLASGFVAFAV